jgi:hypothetical protein
MQSPLMLKKFSVLMVAWSKVLTVDGIAHEGKLWIVPKWRTYIDGTTRPELMIRFDNLEHQKRAIDHDYTLNLPMPQSVLDGLSSEGYETLSEDNTPLYNQEIRTIH